MAQSSYRLEGYKYALALESQWQAEIEKAGSLRQLFERLGIVVDDSLHARIKTSGGLAKFLQGSSQSKTNAIEEHAEAIKALLGKACTKSAILALFDFEGN